MNKLYPEFFKTRIIDTERENCIRDNGSSCWLLKNDTRGFSKLSYTTCRIWQAAK